jgi:hypothetical protein
MNIEKCCIECCLEWRGASFGGNPTKPIEKHALTLAWERHRKVSTEGGPHGTGSHEQQSS